MQGLYKRIHRRYNQMQTYKDCFINDRLALTRAVMKSNLEDEMKDHYLHLFYTEQIPIHVLNDIIMAFQKWM